MQGTKLLFGVSAFLWAMKTGQGDKWFTTHVLTNKKIEKYCKHKNKL